MSATSDVPVVDVQLAATRLPAVRAKIDSVLARLRVADLRMGISVGLTCTLPLFELKADTAGGSGHRGLGAVNLRQTVQEIALGVVRCGEVIVGPG